MIARLYKKDSVSIINPVFVQAAGVVSVQRGNMKFKDIHIVQVFQCADGA